MALSLLTFSVDTSINTSLPKLPDAIDLGNVQVVGVGSVGSAVVYLLDMLWLKGTIQFIDHDAVEYANLNRSPLFGLLHMGKPKVDIATEYLGIQLPTSAFHGHYAQFVEQHGRRKGEIDLILPLANEFGVRPTIEHNFPPLQLYGTTTSDWGVNYHRHIPLKDDCSVCRFSSMPELPPLVCSTAQIQSQQQKPIDAALPFISVAAAVLTVADILKLQLPNYPFTPNFAFFDLKGTLEFVLTYNKPPQSNCLCRSRSSNIHKSYITSTRFASYSHPVISIKAAEE